ncbi:disease resistance RPP13-like protein 4 [Senna tora]|uniref:Disease resistance RPP13-like protein 4 n=1 Tax=Senna tora TaxID=362788 RepID=A0A834W3X6_9FABA|nr:disease resistance RPP13-like protein 4 [Senna tora]
MLGGGAILYTDPGKVSKSPDDAVKTNGNFVGRSFGSGPNRLAEWTVRSSDMDRDADFKRARKQRMLSYERLEKLEWKLCLLFLAIFPENVVLKKRLLIYWWIGEGLIPAEKEGEEIFQELLKLELIIPYQYIGIPEKLSLYQKKFPIVSKCQIHPWVRYMLITLAHESGVFDIDNLGESHFNTSASQRTCVFRGHKDLPSTNKSLLLRFSSAFSFSLIALFSELP